MELDVTTCERARRARDARFDGRFFLAVKTTGIYCRPVCPARPARRDNVAYFATAAACEEAGYRPCRRCRPETAPGTPAWLGSSATVSRALRLIEEGAGLARGVPGLAERLGVGERQLRRLFAEHVGASPGAVARTRRVHFARRLIDETRLPMAQVALAAGFGSVRQFNDAVRETFGRAPGALRHEGRGGEGAKELDSVRLRLPARPPFDAAALLDFLALRAIPGVESVRDGAWRHLFRDEEGESTLVEARPGECGVELRIHGAPDGPRVEALPDQVARVRRVFDLGADPLAIEEVLGRDPLLAPRLAARPGLRVPGAFDGFELAVRVVLGQQVSVKGASTLAGRLAARFGRQAACAEPGLDRLFPEPEDLAEADLARIGLPGARAEALRGLARSAAEGQLELHPAGDPQAAREALQAVPGIGPWTAEVIAMRALADPDAFPEGDLGLRRVLGRDAKPSELLARAEAWRPWRAYAAVCLWTV